MTLTHNKIHFWVFQDFILKVQMSTKEGTCQLALTSLVCCSLPDWSRDTTLSCCSSFCISNWNISLSRSLSAVCSWNLMIIIGKRVIMMLILGWAWWWHLESQYLRCNSRQILWVQDQSGINSKSCTNYDFMVKPYLKNKWTSKNYRNYNIIIYLTNIYCPHYFLHFF